MAKKLMMHSSEEEADIAYMLSSDQHETIQLGTGSKRNRYIPQSLAGASSVSGKKTKNSNTRHIVFQ